MKMISEFYDPPEKALAFHPQPGQSGHMQWWYHDATFDNGYSASIVFHLTEEISMIEFDICDPDGKTYKLNPFFDAKKAIEESSTEVYDIKLGDNRIHGTFPKYHMHFKEEDMACDLTWECTAQTFWEPPDGIYTGREMSPATPKYMAYIIRPRCKVYGTLVLDGKEFQVNGEGYADHQWCSDLLMDMMLYWTWGKVYFPDYSIFFWDAVLSPEMGHQRMKWLWVWKNDKLIEYKNDANMYCVPSDFETDPESGIAYPKKCDLLIDEDRIQGIAKYSMKHMLYKTAVYPSNINGWQQYFRFHADCDAKFNIEGDEVSIKYEEVYETSLK